MVVATHQPIFLPWPGFFAKALRADAFVLLDRVQFPQGRSWMHRNRLKSEQGDHWLRVPVWRTGRGLQIVSDVEICEERDWRTQHLRGIRQLYGHAPYLRSHLPALEAIYARGHRTLVSLNLDLIRYLWRELQVPSVLRLQSELGIDGTGTALLTGICAALKADTYMTLSVSEKYLDLQAFQRRSLDLVLSTFVPPVYPQLWGPFRYNLSALDLLLTCGPKTREIIAAATP
jgi:hypothetical protein